MMSPKFQVYGLIAIAVLLAAIVAITTGSAWQHLSRLRENFNVAQGENFLLAEQVEAQMPTLNKSLRHFDETMSPANLADFEHAGTTLSTLIRSNKDAGVFEGQANLLGELQAALTTYVERSLEFGEKVRQNPSEEKSVSENVKAEAASVLELAEELRRAEKVALAQFMEDSRRVIRSLQVNLLGSIVLIGVLAFLVVRLIHLAKIVPLSTQLAETRIALERKEKLASLGTLAAGVAHEIRNPLTAIKVRLDSLNRSLGGNSEREDAEVIDHEIQRLERIVQDFLQFARPSPPQVENVSVLGLFERVTRLLGSQMERAAIAARIDCPPELQVSCDSQQIEQVLINLVQNAAESIEDGGIITLRGREDAAFFNGAPMIVLEIADTGKGIAPEVERRLFDPFFSTKESGTGLGLSIAARIVEKHGGLLRYKTELGRGTTFTIGLPGGEDSPKEGLTQTSLGTLVGGQQNPEICKTTRNCQEAF